MQCSANTFESWVWTPHFDHRLSEILVIVRRLKGLLFCGRRSLKQPQSAVSFLLRSFIVPGFHKFWILVWSVYRWIFLWSTTAKTRQSSGKVVFLNSLSSSRQFLDYILIPPFMRLESFFETIFRQFFFVNLVPQPFWDLFLSELSLLLQTENSGSIPVLAPLIHDLKCFQLVWGFSNSRSFGLLGFSGLLWSSRFVFYFYLSFS